MKIVLNRIGGIYLIAVAVAVAVHAVVEPLFHVTTAAAPYSATWSIPNPLMTLAIVLGLAVAAGPAHVRVHRTARPSSAVDPGRPGTRARTSL